MFKYLCLILSFCVHNLFAAEESGCNKANIYYTEANISIDQPELGTYKYYFQYIKKADPSVPTIIVIPGGPGGKSIDQSPENPYFDWNQILYAFPSKYNAILTDPRTIGCNGLNKDLPVETFTSQNVANDIVSIINNLHINNYIILGHSYGTLVATLLGKMASEGIIPPPKAIVISGTMGHYFRNHKQEVLPSYFKAWRNLDSLLPKNIQDLFPKKDDWSDFGPDHVMPLGLSVNTWANYVFSNLTEGGSYQKGQLVYPFLNKLLILNSGNEVELLKFKTEISASVPESVKPQLELNKLFHDSIWCQELEENQQPECVLQKFSFNNPFDSKNFQITNIPIIYIHGEFDPAVPIDQSIYHYKQQENIRKFFMIAKDGGHTSTIALTDCKEPFWHSVFGNIAEIPDSLKACVGIKLITP